jgi:hypothetical protein
MLQEEEITEGVDEGDEYTIYTHDENKKEIEFNITDINTFLDNQEDPGRLLTELELKVAFFQNLKYGIKSGKLRCFDTESSDSVESFEAKEEYLKYLEKAIPSNLRVICKIREYLGMDPEPDIKPSILTTEFMKSQRNLN